MGVTLKIYLARHGQSRWQIERDGTDWNSPLTDLGQMQATFLANWLAKEPALDNGAPLEVTALHASPYLRAQQTALPVSRSLGLPVITDEALREANFLVSDHLPRAEAPFRPSDPYTPTESYASLKAQAEKALQSLLEGPADQGGAALAISHGGLISTMLRLIAGSDTVSFWVYNASLHLIEWKRGRWHLVCLNLWDHLPPELRTY